MTPIEEPTNPPFEGVEKRLILEVSPDAFSGTGPEISSFLDVKRETWNKILATCRCKILSVLESDPKTHITICDSALQQHSQDHDSPSRCPRAYLLSESTLLVWRYRILLKTCGTTAPLLLLPALQNELFSLQPCIPSIRVFLYTRFELLFPEQQFWPHRSFAEEQSFLRQFFEPRLTESRIINVGRLFYVYCYGRDPTPFHSTEMLMLGTDPQCQDKFRSSCLPWLRTVKTEPGQEVAPLDEYFFDPCGYSCNIVHPSGYFADVHISPEESVSFASVELRCCAHEALEANANGRSMLKDTVMAFGAERFALATVEISPADWSNSRRLKGQQCATVLLKRTPVRITCVGGCLEAVGSGCAVKQLSDGELQHAMSSPSTITSARGARADYPFSPEGTSGEDGSDNNSDSSSEFGPPKFNRNPYAEGETVYFAQIA